MLESFIAGEQRQLEKPTTWVGWSERKADQLFAQLGVDPERSARVEESLQTQKVVFSETQDHNIPELYKAAAEGSSVVSAVLSLIQSCSRRSNANLDALDFVTVDPAEGAVEVAMKVLTHLRANKDYDRFEETAFTLMQKKFQEEFAGNLSQTEKNSYRAEAERFAKNLVNEHREGWQNPSVESRSKGAVPLTATQDD